jgi:protein-tyrosine phosphatase
MNTTTKLQDKVQNLLPEIQQGQVPEAQIQELMNEIRQEIKQEPTKGKELGRLIPMINKALKDRVNVPHINWQPVGKGHLAIGHKPGGKISFEGMKLAGVTTVLTLLQEKEGAGFIGNALNKVEIDWIWFPFSASSPHQGEQLPQVEQMFRKVEEALEAGHKIYIHCSAGIHRTGMVTYGLLRYLGQDAEAALKSLEQLREITAEGATDERLKWGDQFAEGK